jgi:hypothetical protein
LDYCQHWKAKSGGYETSDLFYYESDMVEALLPSVLRGDFNITAQLNLGRPGRPSAPNEGGNLMAMMIEVDYGFWKLSKEDRRILFMRHAESLDFKEIANVLSLGSEDASRMRHKRAIGKLVRRLGGYKPYNDKDFAESEESEEEEPPLQGEQ